MKAYVITIEGFEPSETSARRCIESAARFGIDVQMWWAMTPADHPESIFRHRGWPTTRFLKSTCSKPAAVMATFLSHYGLWSVAASTWDPVLILEHDAVFVSELPDLSQVDGLCNLGAPSFGKFVTPEPGLGPQRSCDYMKGAHGYYVTPSGAERIIADAHNARATDIYLCRSRFKWMQEFYPWPIECHDSFSTIQNEVGAAPHLRPVKVLDWYKETDS